MNNETLQTFERLVQQSLGKTRQEQVERAYGKLLKEISEAYVVYTITNNLNHNDIVNDNIAIGQRWERNGASTIL